MGDTMNKSAADTAAASALTQPACVALGTDENGYTFSWDEDVDKCVAAAPVGS